MKYIEWNLVFTLFDENFPDSLSESKRLEL